MSAHSLLGDDALIAINGAITKLADIGYEPSLPTQEGLLTLATGGNNFTYNMASTRDHIFGLGVIGITHFAGTSMLIVDDFQVSAVPEYYEMLLVGLYRVFLIARKRHNFKYTNY